LGFFRSGSDVFLLDKVFPTAVSAMPLGQEICKGEEQGRVRLDNFQLPTQIGIVLPQVSNSFTAGKVSTQ